jgi:cell division septation protein DedD
LIVRLGKKIKTEGKAKLKDINVSPQAIESSAPGVDEDTAGEEQGAVKAKLKSPEDTVQQEQTTKSSELASGGPALTDIPAGSEDQKKEPVTSLSGNRLSPGHYVVVGVFHSAGYAKKYAFNLKRAKYPANVAYYPEKRYYIVHMNNAPPTKEEAQKLCNEYRRMSRYTFRDTWIISVE